MLTQPHTQINRSTGERWPVVMNASSLIFAGDLLMLPAGLLIVGLLTRGLGPEGYGSFAVSASLVTGLEWALASVLSRSTIYGVSQARDWPSVARKLFNWHLTLGIAAVLVLWIVAAPLATMLHEPQFASYFALLACDIPFFLLGQAYRNILIGRGHFGLRALTGASRWISRLVLTAVAVQAGISVMAAIGTCIGASLVEFAVGRLSLGPLKSAGTDDSVRLKRLAATLMVSTLSLAILGKMDLLLIKALGLPAQQAGFYAAAQNLALMPGIFGQAISAVVLSVLTRLASERDFETFRNMAQQSLTAGLCLLPVAGVVAGGATEITTLCFGQPFQSASNVLPALFMGAVAQVMFGLMTSVLTAGGHAALTALLAGTLLFTALGSHLWSIPLWGPLGAAWTTALTLLAGTTVAYVAALNLLHVKLSFVSLALATSLGAIGWWAVIHVPTDPLSRLSGVIFLSVLLTAIFAWHGSLIDKSMLSFWRLAWQRDP
jgi:O-antigen/teichoic acid export membrane protein